MMDLWSLQVKNNSFLLRNPILEKPVSWNLRNSAMALEIRKPFPDSCKYRSVLVNAMGKKNHGSSNSSSGDGDKSKPGGDNPKRSKPESNASGDSGSQNQKSHKRPLDWREFRASLYIQEQAETMDSEMLKQDKTSQGPKSLPLKWAHPISTQENGCLLVATEKLDGQRCFERTVILLLRAGNQDRLRGPSGIIINRSLHKKMKHMNSTNVDLATTFADCSLHFGGPLESSMFLVRTHDATGLRGFPEVIPGVRFGEELDKASALVKKGTLVPQDFRFFVGFAGWEFDQLRDEIERGFWHVAACSADLIMGSSSPDGLWEEILQLMGGHYSELSRKPKQDL